MDTLQAILSSINDIQNSESASFWSRGDFWIGVIVSLAGTALSWFAFVEAKAAKKAAKEAGRVVRIQTITIELTEISQRLDKLDANIDYSTMRDLLNEISRRIRRLISPFDNEEYPDLKETITLLRTEMESAKTSLENVRPINITTSADSAFTVYYAIEGHLTRMNGFVADLLGMFEKRTISQGT